MNNKKRLKKVKRNVRHFKAKVLDVFLFPLTVISAIWFRRIRRLGIHNMPLTAATLRLVKIYPLKNHFYEPLIDRSSLDRKYRNMRVLRSFNWNTVEQLKILDSFSFQNELKEIQIEYTNENLYHYDNSYFGAGDAEYFYSIIRRYKPNKIIEIGSGYSTLIGIYAISKNKEEDKSYSCEYVCVEPYKRKWLETLPVKLVRKRIESIEIEQIDVLNKNDILFIDSSHMIRPQRNVLHEYLNLLPQLKSGVLVHIHDVFSPQDYPNEWIIDGDKFWNEQYLVEAFMSFNSDFRIIGALNYLFNEHKESICKKLPMVRIIQPKYLQSFWIARN